MLPPRRPLHPRVLIMVGALGVIAITATTIGVVSRQNATAAAYPTAKQSYGSPFWSDEFSGRKGTRPDTDTWTTETGNRDQEGWWNNELQYYTDSPANSSLSGSGQLLIHARQSPANQKLPCWPEGECAYTSARLTTEGSVSLTSGRIDVRAKIPTGQGLLPAVWMLGNNGETWPAQGELDVVEVVGSEPRTVYGTAHGPTYFNENGIGATTRLAADARSGYHVYSIDKKKKSITWLVDNVPYFTLTPADLPSPRDWVFEQDLHVLLNVAVGGDWPGDPSNATSFPATMTIDYVRLFGSGFVHGESATSR